MEFLNDYFTWFQQNESTLKNMSPAKAKGKIIYELMMRGLASPELRNIHLEVGPDGKITDASLNFMTSKMQQNVVSSEVVYAMFEKRKKEMQIETIDKLEDLIHGFKEEEKCHIHGADDNKPHYNITFDENYHNQVKEIQQKGGDVKRFIANHIGSQIREQQKNNQRLAEAMAKIEPTSAPAQNQQSQALAQPAPEQADKEVSAPEAKGAKSAGASEYNVDEIIYSYLNNGEITPEEEAYLRTQDINGLEELKSMIPPGMLPPELSMDGPSDLNQ